MKQTLSSLQPKTVRMSKVALAAAVMAVVWALVDEFANQAFSPIIVSSITSLVMLLAQFADFRAKHEGAEVFEGEPE